MYGRFSRCGITDRAILARVIGREGTILGRLTNAYSGSLFDYFFMQAFMYRRYRGYVYNECLIPLVF